MERGRQLSIISFTEKGRKLSEAMAGKLGDMDVSVFTKHRSGTGQKGGMDARGGCFAQFVESPVGQWAGTQMEKGNAMLFIGACGIAVRAVAPYVADKLHDSPVLVMDEKGRYVIPVLSGHMGGANCLACYLAEKTGAEPVITTATDINGTFAVDLFAKRNGLFIVDRKGIAKVSSKALDGKAVTLSIEPGHVKAQGSLPKGLYMADYPPLQPVDVVVTSQGTGFDAAVVLRPREYVVGMGCRKGKGRAEIEALLLREMDRLGICTAQVFALASISQKRSEQGIVEWCRKERIPFVTYTAQELRETEGTFKSSSFVKETVGVDNVCERAALRACGCGGRLVSEKRAENGMTLAVARREWMVDFGEE